MASREAEAGDILKPSPGIEVHSGGLDEALRQALLQAVLELIAEAPWFRPRMPKSGRPLSVLMSNAGPLGWVADARGYRYTSTHPESGRPWPAMPEPIAAIWRRFARFPAPAECCLINLYREGARMGLHQDRDEEELSAPVVSVSLGDTAIFRIGGATRRGPTQTVRLVSGDVVVLSGPARLAYHGIDRVLHGSSRLVPGGGRINLTLRRVRPA